MASCNRLATVMGSWVRSSEPEGAPDLRAGNGRRAREGRGGRSPYSEREVQVGGKWASGFDEQEAASRQSLRAGS